MPKMTASGLAALCLCLSVTAESAHETHKVKFKSIEWEYHLYVPKTYEKEDWQFHRIALLVHGVGGNGDLFTSNSLWKEWADKNGIFLLGPTFTNPKAPDDWYWKPEAGSGKLAVDMVKDAADKYRVYPGQLLLFGFSGGGQFAHRFAAMHPELIAAFAFASPDSVSPPTKKLSNSPALIMCGEADNTRIAACRQYYEQAQKLGLRPVWRSWKGVAHSLNNEGLRLAQAFLRYHMLRSVPAAEKLYERLVKDAQKKAGHKPPKSSEGGHRRVIPFLMERPPFVGIADQWIYMLVTDPRSRTIPPDKVVFLPDDGTAKIWGNPMFGGR